MMITNQTTRSRVCTAASDVRSERGLMHRTRKARQGNATQCDATQGTATQGKRAVLRDGSEILIRQIQSADSALLADGFARLSPKSRQSRFLMAKTALSPSELRYLTEIDHHDHEALGAVSPVDGRGVGIARYVRDSEHPDAAEVAVTVVDDWQRRGLGSELVAALTDRARQEGIRRFTASVAADNIAVIGLLRKMSADVELVGHESGILEYEIILARDELHAVLAALWQA